MIRVPHTFHPYSNIFKALLHVVSVLIEVVVFILCKFYQFFP